MSLTKRLLIWLQALLGRPAALVLRADMLVAHDAAWSAFPLFARAARRGLPEAQRRVGESYLSGQGVPANLAEALRWLNRAAEAGDASAQAQLASLALQGARAPPPGTLFGPAPDGPPDFERAECWSRRAAAAGSAEGKVLLGLVLTSGPADRRDPEAGLACYREAAKAGSSRARLALAMALLCSGGGTDAAHEAQILLHDAAEEGIPAARFVTGALAESGAAGETDFAGAAEAYRAAAEQGHVEAQFRYGLALLVGRGVPIDLFNAETWLRRAALSGHLQAAAALGDFHAVGKDPPPNPAEAAIWYQRAAEGGHPGAARQLGRAYLFGRGVRKDIGLAVYWLHAAIRDGDEMAQVDMAQLSLTRQSSLDDQRETAAWFRRLAEAGNPAAWFNLGLCLAEGVGVARDEAAARDCFHRAADAVPAAREHLAQMDAVSASV